MQPRPCRVVAVAPVVVSCRSEDTKYLVHPSNQCKPVSLFFSPELSASPVRPQFRGEFRAATWPHPDPGGIINALPIAFVPPRTDRRGSARWRDITQRKSLTTTGGPGRAPNRAMLRAVGFPDDDFDRP